MRHFSLIALAFVLATLCGCVKQTTPSHPNQINAFDGIAYDTLVSVQAGLTQAKALAPQFPQYKVALNDAIVGYNAAIAAYKLYHAGASGAPDTATLQAQITTLVGSVGSLLTEMGVKL